MVPVNWEWVTYLTRFQWNITRSLYQNVYLICNIQPLCSFPYMMFNLISQCMDLISEVITRPTECTHPELSFQTAPFAKMPTGAPPWTKKMCGRLAILTRCTYGAWREEPARDTSKDWTWLKVESAAVHQGPCTIKTRIASLLTGVIRWIGKMSVTLCLFP